MSKHDDEGFEGNAQSFRIITKLVVRFPDSPGIDLTRATLAACLKYPWFRKKTGKGSKKWSAYSSEKYDFDFAREFLGHDEKTLEAELMDWADDVAYSVHDLEDFHRCNALPWQRVFDEKERIIEHAAGVCVDKKEKQKLAEAYERLKNYLEGTYSILLGDSYDGTRLQREQLRRMTSQLIGTYIGAIKINPDMKSDKAVLFNDNLLNEVKVLKQITRDYIIASPTLAAQQHGQQKIIKDLFGALWEGYDRELGYPPFLPIRLRFLAEVPNITKARLVADCIASLSESEATALHARLFGMAPGSVLNPIVR